jgi:hypothetical protein
MAAIISFGQSIKELAVRRMASADRRKEVIRRWNALTSLERAEWTEKTLKQQKRARPWHSIVDLNRREVPLVQKRAHGGVGPLGSAHTDSNEQEEDVNEEKMNLMDVRRELVNAKKRLEDALEEEANVKKQRLDYQESSSSSSADSSSEDEEDEEERNY